ncbi:MAG: isoleucine--tRNA ligase [Alphaproteobacteria bacterium]|nr:isoleucine--tRNA ligase [Alphaproteobacteria bacterium]
MKFPKTEPKANFPELEHQILNLWRKNDTFRKSSEQTKNGVPFSFYDGPPTPSSKPHVGHIGVSAVKDMVVRFQTMLGRCVIHQFGWDVHGLPTEVTVEKQTGKSANDIVKEKGVEEFCDMCRNGVMLYANEWRNYIKRIGRWVEFGDTGQEYITMDVNYMESVLWALKELYNKGLLFEDYKVNPYSWKLGTVVSNADAAKQYQDVVDDAITVWFELENGRRLLAWTTTPWTLPGNSLLAVNPKMNYIVMKDEDGKEYIIAESRLKAYEKQFAKANKIGNLMGSELVGLSYRPLFDYYKDHKDRTKLYKIIPADYVSDSSGTGIVHIAPAYGEEDFLAARALDSKFPVILNVDNYGNFTKEVENWAGENIFEANPKIIEFLKKAGVLIKKEQYVHSYPFDDRTHTKLIYRATDSWYIDVPAIRDRLIKNNKLVNWTSAGERFTKWIENARPWAITRNRFWGTPLPIWKTDNPDDGIKFFGSVAELEEFFGVNIDDLHRPTLDKLEKDGWKRIPDVLDCWFDAGSMPFAALHYPFENAEKFNTTFPTDYIIEGIDQTRGWFYTLMVLATALFDKPAFKTVTANGMTLDEDKQKMSKSLGNFEDPQKLFDIYGADAVRIYLLGSNFIKAEPVLIDKAGKVFNEPIKNILVPLWNAYHFFTLYANAGNVTINFESHTENRNILDTYILTELDELYGTVIHTLNIYKPDIAIKEFIKFLDTLNNWYIRRSRERFWNEDQGAFGTLWHVLTTLCKLLAPFAPFISDYIYRNLTNKESVHLARLNDTKDWDVNYDLLTYMRHTQSIISTGKKLRETYKLRNRLPLAKLTIIGKSLSEYTDIIKDELNIKNVEFSDDISSVADSFVYLVTPKIGARLGSKLKEIMAASKQPGFNPADWDLLPDEFETRLNIKPGVTGAALPDNTAVVMLDTNITPELISEGLARDALRFIQDSRKEKDLDVSDRIILEYSADTELADAINTHSEMIKENALITDMRLSPVGGGDYSIIIEGYKFEVKIKKI